MNPYYLTEVFIGRRLMYFKLVKKICYFLKLWFRNKTDNKLIKNQINKRKCEKEIFSGEILFSQCHHCRVSTNVLVSNKRTINCL